MRYVALVDGKKGAYGVVVPDLPGCTSAIDAAYRNAVEAVRLWVEDALEDGERLPRPRSLMELAADREVRRALAGGAALIMVPMVRQRRAGEDSARDLINQSPSPNAKRGPSGSFWPCWPSGLEALGLERLKPCY